MLAGAAPPTANASVVATYDLSCPTSPYGSVHNPQKGPIGDRIAQQLLRYFAPTPAPAPTVTEGPRATSAKVEQLGAGSSRYRVTVDFSGGSAPFAMRATKNCTTCCGGSAPTGKATDGHTLDFDVCSAVEPPYETSP